MSNPLHDQLSNWCRHFTGNHNGQCEAGITYADVVDRTNRPARYPCLRSDECTDRCTQASFRSQAEVQERIDEIHKVAREALAKMVNNICPQCGSAVEKYEEIGWCTYAMPCGHRTGRGKFEEQS